MKIFIDADACPVPAKEILYRISERLKIPLVLVANQYMRVPPSTLIECIQVASGADEADNRIVELIEEGDLAITADIPLADRVIQKKATVIDPRGDLLTPATIGHRLSMRNFMDEMRTQGMETGGPKPYGPKEKQLFAQQLDKWLSKTLKTKGR